MKKHKPNNWKEKADKALEQAGSERYRSNPFLYTRIKQALVQEPKSERRQWQLQWQLALMLVLVILNIGVAWQYMQSIRSTYSGSDATALAAQYGWHDQSASDYMLSPDLNTSEDETAE